MSTEEKAKTGIELIAKERFEQKAKHGRTVTKDVIENAEGQLLYGAIALFTLEDCPKGWNKDLWHKMTSKSYKERLIIAGYTTNKS